MLHRVAGGEARWRARPFVSMSSCFVVPPLRFAEDACRCLEAAVRGGMPVLLLAAGQAGATSPAALAGAVVQEVAEVLAGLVYVNALSPGHPAIFGTWPFVSDLRTGAMSGGSGEQAVLMAACAQMGRFYDLPTGIAAGMADSKLPDAQAGYEKGYTTVLAGHSGANLVYESAGMLGSLLGACLESFVIDNDMLGAVNRSVRGVDIDDESLSLETMREVCTQGPNHFLGHPQTLGLMQREYVYPEVGDRTSPKEWGEQGSTDAVERAAARCPRDAGRALPPRTSRRASTRSCARSFGSCSSRLPAGSARTGDAPVRPGEQGRGRRPRGTGLQRRPQPKRHRRSRAPRPPRHRRRSASSLRRSHRGHIGRDDARGGVRVAPAGLRRLTFG